MSRGSRPHLAACRAAYDEHASEYARALDPTLVRLAERLAKHSDAGAGHRVLDVATGTGAVARACAVRGASVVAVDISEPMLAVAREQSPDVEFRSADVHQLPFGEREFDAVVCGLALSHFDDLPRALGEIRRVLRGGGRFAASTWAAGGGVPSSAVVVTALERHGAYETGYTLDEGKWLDPSRGAALLRRAGFADVRVKHERFSGRFTDAEEALRWTLACPCGSARLARLDPAAREAALGEARRGLAGGDLSWAFSFNLYVAEAPIGLESGTGWTT